MKSKVLMAIAVAGAFAAAGAMADDSISPKASNESGKSMAKLGSYEGGYKGAGGMANPLTPLGQDETLAYAPLDLERDHKKQLAEVDAARNGTWDGNPPKDIGGTRSEGRGFGRFFGRR